MSDSIEVAEESAPEPVTLHGCPLLISYGQQVAHVPRDRYVDVVKALLADGYEMCVDLTAVDYLRMPNRVVPADVVAERFERLRIVIDRSGLAKHEARVGRTEEVVVEGPSRKDPDVLTGRTRQNKLVHFRSESPLSVGTFADVVITRAAPHHLFGDLVAVTAKPRHRTRIPVTAG